MAPRSSPCRTARKSATAQSGRSSGHLRHAPDETVARTARGPRHEPPRERVERSLAQRGQHHGRAAELGAQQDAELVHLGSPRQRVQCQDQRDRQRREIAQRGNQREQRLAVQPLSVVHRENDRLGLGGGTH